MKEYGRNLPTNLKPQEIELAGQFAKALIAPFRPERFHDEYQQRVQKLVDNKAKGEAPPKQERVQRLAPVVDLMDALKKSIAGQGKSTKPKSMRKTA